LILALVVLLFALVGLGAFGYVGAVQGQQEAYQIAHERHQTIEQLSKNNDALRAQIQGLGQKPVAPPAADVVNQSAAAAPGRNGTNGVNGIDGISINSVVCDAAGVWQVSYSNGKSESDFGPCVATPGAAGTNGTNGTNGADGAPGAPGADGQPPLSWTFTTQQTDLLGNTTTTTHTCTRDAPFDPSAPTYTCAPTS
jgi:hypothetical protein